MEENTETTKFGSDEAVLRAFCQDMGAEIRARRVACGLDHVSLAERSGISASTISNIEAGYQPTTLRTIGALAVALGTSPAALCGGRTEARVVGMRLDPEGGCRVELENAHTITLVDGETPPRLGDVADRRHVWELR